MKKTILDRRLTIIAGPCSIDERNIEDVYRISEIEVVNRRGERQKAVAGARVVGLKSRTALESDEKEMGMDFSVFRQNLGLFLEGRSMKELKVPPSLKLARAVTEATGMMVATEIVSPLQLSLYEKMLGKKRLLIWNPAVEQLGWSILKMAAFAKRNSWWLGLKNGKWLGEKNNGQTTMEKAWIGLARYAGFNQPESDKRLVLIHRGVDIEGKGDYRSLPVHQAAERVKEATGARLFFDPSHSCGPRRRGMIVAETIKAMKMETKRGGFLYDGILIEVGRSRTDAGQHISVEELRQMCQALAGFRYLEAPGD